MENHLFMHDDDDDDFLVAATEKVERENAIDLMDDDDDDILLTAIENVERENADETALMSNDDDLLISVGENTEWVNAFETAIDGLVMSNMDLSEYYENIGQILTELNGGMFNNYLTINYDNPIEGLTVDTVLYDQNGYQYGKGWNHDAIEHAHGISDSNDGVDWGIDHGWSFLNEYPVSTTTGDVLQQGGA